MSWCLAPAAWMLVIPFLSSLLLLSANPGYPTDRDFILDVPYLASLRLRGLHSCAAVVIGADWLLTAAHCVEGQLNHWVSACVGGDSKAEGSRGTTYQASQILIHPGYNPRNMDCNIALVKVSHEMQLGPRVYAVSVADPNTSLGVPSLTSGTAVRASGWHIDQTDGAGSVRVLEVKTVDSDKCDEHYRQYGGITPRMFCLGYSTEGKTLCNSDGGSPLVVDNLLVGLVSHGQGCTDPNVPVVATRVPSYVSWIKRHTGLTSNIASRGTPLLSFIA